MSNNASHKVCGVRILLDSALCTLYYVGCVWDITTIDCRCTLPDRINAFKYDANSETFITVYIQHAELCAIWTFLTY